MKRYPNFLKIEGMLAIECRGYEVDDYGMVLSLKDTASVSWSDEAPLLTSMINVLGCTYRLPQIIPQPTIWNMV